MQFETLLNFLRADILNGFAGAVVVASGSTRVSVTKDFAKRSASRSITGQARSGKRAGGSICAATGNRRKPRGLSLGQANRVGGEGWQHTEGASGIGRIFR